MWEVFRSKFRGPKSDRGSLERPSRSRTTSATVNFKDLTLACDEDDDDEGAVSGLGEVSPSEPSEVRRLERTKQVIIMVGLPGRGKTFLCNKLKCYLNWLGHNTKHINVGGYRRSQKPDGEVQSAAFFSKDNPHGIEARNRALRAALEDLHQYLESSAGQIVIFDATNTTEERRQQLITEFHGRYQYLFIESITNDEKILDQNYRFKMMYSPDYKGVNVEQAIADFKSRIVKYEEVYEPITNRNLHYIKLIDMVTGRGYLDINRISGYIPGKIVFFLMQVCKAGMAQARKIWLTRHGESAYNVLGKIGGDSQLSPLGEEYAQVLPEVLLERLPLTFDDQPIPVSVWTSTLKRTIETAQYLPFPKLRWKALDEIHAGSCDGMTYEEIAERFPNEYKARQEDKLRYRYPAGESYLDVVQRLEPAVIEMERERECVCIVGHQAVLRVILGYCLGTPLKDIPTLSIPLHTLIELRPRPDGTMEVELVPVPVGTGAVQPQPPAKPPPVQVPLGTTLPPGHHRASSSGAIGIYASPSHSARPSFSALRGSASGSLSASAAGSAAAAAHQQLLQREQQHRRSASGSSTATATPEGSARGGSAGIGLLSAFVKEIRRVSASGASARDQALGGQLPGQSASAPSPLRPEQAVQAAAEAEGAAGQQQGAGDDTEGGLAQPGLSAPPPGPPAGLLPKA